MPFYIWNGALMVTLSFFLHNDVPGAEGQLCSWNGPFTCHPTWELTCDSGEGGRVYPHWVESLLQTALFLKGGKSHSVLYATIPLR